MPIGARLEDGTILRFPDDTHPDVVDRTVRQHLGLEGPNPPEADLAAASQPARMTMARGGQRTLQNPLPPEAPPKYGPASARSNMPEAVPLSPYDTRLSPDEEAQFRSEFPDPKSTQDYDMRGAWKGGATAAANGHLPDTWKKPNHVTFSDESMYHGVDGQEGGQWVKQADGRDLFSPGPTNFRNSSKAAMQQYFRDYEPTADLGGPTPRAVQRVQRAENLTNPTDREVVENVFAKPRDQRPTASLGETAESLPASIPPALAASAADMGRTAEQLDLRIQQLERVLQTGRADRTVSAGTGRGGVRLPDQVLDRDELRNVQTELARLRGERQRYMDISSGGQAEAAANTPPNESGFGQVVRSTIISAPSMLAGGATGMVLGGPVGAAVGVGLGAWQQAAQSNVGLLDAGYDAQRRLSELAASSAPQAYVQSVLKDPNAPETVRKSAQRVADTLDSIEMKRRGGLLSAQAARQMSERAMGSFQRDLQQISRGADAALANVKGFIDGAAEGVGEAIGLGPVWKSLKMAGLNKAGFFASLPAALGTQFSQEAATQIVQSLTDRMWADPNLTFDEALEQVIQAGAGGALMGAAMHGPAHLAGRAREAHANNPYRQLNDAVEGAQFNPAATDAAVRASMSPNPNRIPNGSQSPPAPPAPGSAADLRRILADERPVSDIRKADADESAAALAPHLDAAASGIAAQQAEADAQMLQGAAAAGIPVTGSPVTATFADGHTVNGTVIDIQAGIDPDTGDDTHDVWIRTPEGREVIASSGNAKFSTPALGGNTPDNPVVVETGEHTKEAAKRIDDERTTAEILAGNDRKAHVEIHGLNITLENAKGSERQDRNHTPPQWTVPHMPAHYGFIKRTEGADGDQVDVYVGDVPQSRQVWVVDQIDPATGSFDETKSMLAFSNPVQARNAYIGGFSDGSGASRIGAMTHMSIEQFKDWLKTGDTTKALSYVKPERNEVHALALQAQREAGWNSAWPFIPADLLNGDFRNLIRSDPTLSDAEKSQILTAGFRLGVVPKNESVYVTPPEKPNVPSQGQAEGQQQTPVQGPAPGGEQRPASGQGPAAQSGQEAVPAQAGRPPQPVRQEGGPAPERPAEHVQPIRPADAVPADAAGPGSASGNANAGGQEAAPALRNVPSVADLHALATRLLIPWDNNAKFMAFTKRITGQEHLDALSDAERMKLAAALYAGERPEINEGEPNAKNAQDSPRPGGPTFHTDDDVQRALTDGTLKQDDALAGLCHQVAGKAAIAKIFGDQLIVVVNNGNGGRIWHSVNINDDGYIWDGTLHVWFSAKAYAATTDFHPVHRMTGDEVRDFGRRTKKWPSQTLLGLRGSDKTYPERDDYDANWSLIEPKSAPAAPEQADESEPVQAFPTRAAAEQRAKRLTKLGQRHKAIPHPTIDGKFAVEPVETKPPTEAQIAARAAAGDRLRRANAARDRPNPEKDSLLPWLAKRGGLSMTERADTIGEGNRAFNGAKWLFTSKGEKIDIAASAAYEDGYLTQEEMADGGVSALQRKIGEEYSGRIKHYSSYYVPETEGNPEEDQVWADAEALDVPVVGLTFEQVKAAVDTALALQAALVESEADREVRLEIEAQQAQHLQPEEHDESPGFEVAGENPTAVGGDQPRAGEQHQPPNPPEAGGDQADGLGADQGTEAERFRHTLEQKRPGYDVDGFRRHQAELRAHRDAVAEKLTRIFERDGVVRGDRPNGRWILLTHGTTGAPFRVTSFDTDGTPTGHLEYKQVTGGQNEYMDSALGEFLSKDITIDERPGGVAQKRQPYDASQPGFDLEAPSPEKLAADAERVKAAAAAQKREADAAARREKNARDKKELQDREAKIRKERADAAVAGFELGQKAPSKDVTKDEASGQGGLFQRKTPYNPDQLPLIYDHVETRPGTTQEQRATGIAALRALFGGDRRAGATLLGSALWSGFQERAGAELKGQRVGSPQDLATLAQILRDPRFETLRVFYVKAGRVVGHTGWTSRIPGSVSFAADSTPQSRRATNKNASQLERYKQLASEMEALEADGYYLLHNHPSGMAKPSDEDEQFTRAIAHDLPGFKGHVTIDHGEYGSIDAKGKSTIHPIAQPAQAAPELAHDALGKPMGNTTQAVAIAKSLQVRTGFATLITTDGLSRVKALAELPQTLLAERRGGRAIVRIRKFFNQTGSAGHIFLVSSNPEQFDWLIKNGWVTDVVGTDGRSRRESARITPFQSRPNFTKVVMPMRQTPPWYQTEPKFSKMAPESGEPESATRRKLLLGALAAAVAGPTQAADSATLGKAFPIAERVLSQRVSPAVEKILRAQTRSELEQIARGIRAGKKSDQAVMEALDGFDKSGALGATTLRRAMQEIASNGPQELRPLAVLIARLLPADGLRVVVNDFGEYNVHGMVEFEPMPTLTLFTAGGRHGLYYDTLLHESLHAVVAARYLGISSALPHNYKVLKRTEPAGMSALDQFRTVWREFKQASAGDVAGADKDTQVAVSESMRDPDEFFARALTDPYLQAYMAGKEYKGKTLWERFKDWVKYSLFGFKREGTVPSWLDAALLASSDLTAAMAGDKPDFSFTKDVTQELAKEGRKSVMASKMADFDLTPPPPKGMKTVVMGVPDTVLGRDGLTPEYTQKSIAFAKEVFDDVGLEVVPRGKGLWDVADHNADPGSLDDAGHALLERFKRELRRKGTVDESADLASLATSMAEYLSNDDNVGFSEALRLQFYSYGQGERSQRGVGLGILSQLEREEDAIRHARNPATYLHKEYVDRFDGQGVQLIVDDVLKAFRAQFTDAELGQMAAKAPDLMALLDKLARTVAPESGGRLYRTIQRLYKDKKPKSLAALVEDAEINEAAQKIIEDLQQFGIEPKPQPGKKKLTPMEMLMLMVNEETAARIDDKIADAVSEAERNAGIEAALEAASPDEKNLMREAFARGDQPTQDMIEKGLESPRYRHWKHIRDDLLGYSPTTVKLVQQVIQGEFKGAQFGKPAAKPVDLRLDLNELAKGPEVAVRHALDRHVAAIEDVMDLGGATLATRQRIADMIKDNVTAQVEAIRERVRDKTFEPPPATVAASLTPEQRLHQLFNAGLLADTRLANRTVTSPFGPLRPAMERIAASSRVQRLMPNMKTLLAKVFETPFYRQSELANRFGYELSKHFGLSGATRKRAEELFRTAYAQRFSEAHAKALAQVKKSLTPTQAKVVKRHNRLWEQIERAVNAGAFDTADIMRDIARAAGWTVPSVDDLAEIKTLAKDEQKLRELTDAERATAERHGNVAEATEEKAAAHEAERNRLKREMQALWLRWTAPLSWRTAAGRENIARAVGEIASGNLLLRPGFFTRQIIDVATQNALYTPSRAVTEAWVRRGNDKAAGRDTRLLGDVVSAMGDAYKARAAALRPALYNARRALKGRSETKNVEQILDHISVFDRAELKADELKSTGNVAGALALRIATVFQMGFRVAKALDEFSGTLVEAQEMQAQVMTELRAHGLTADEAKLRTPLIIGDMKAEWMLALARTEELFTASGHVATPQQVRESAWDLVKSRQYARIAASKLLGDDFRALNKLLRNTIGWNEAEEAGFGGWIAKTGKGLQHFGEVATGSFKGAGAVIGLPAIAMSRFANSMGTAVNRTLTFTPAGFSENLFSWKDANDVRHYSPFYNTERDKIQQKIYAAIGTSLGLTMFALVAAGLIKVLAKWPDDEAERDLWRKQGRQPGTIEISLGGGRVSTWSLTVGPFALVRPWLVFMGTVMDGREKEAKAQEKLKTRADKKGLDAAAAEKSAVNLLFAAGAAAYTTILGGRTAGGLLTNLTDNRSELNPARIVSGAVSPLIPGVPQWQEWARLNGVQPDYKSDSVLDFLLPTQGDGGKTNFFGDPVNDATAARVVRVLTGGNQPWPSRLDKSDDRAYQVLIDSGWRPPPAHNVAHAIGGQFRQFDKDEMRAYLARRGALLKEAVGQFEPSDDMAELDQQDELDKRYKQVNEQAVQETILEIANATKGTGASPKMPALKREGAKN